MQSEYEDVPESRLVIIATQVSVDVEEVVEDEQVLEPRVCCMRTERYEGVGDVGVRAQHEICKSAKGALEWFDAESRMFGWG